MGLTLDPQLIRDLTVLITSSTVGGMVLEALKQPVINGFFIAGSIVGPGGFKLIKVAPCFYCMPELVSCIAAPDCSDQRVLLVAGQLCFTSVHLIWPCMSGNRSRAALGDSAFIMHDALSLLPCTIYNWKTHSTVAPCC